MKKTLYSVLAVSCAVAGVATSKTKVFANHTYLYAGSTPETQHDVTLTINWILVIGGSSSCPSSSEIPCAIVVINSGATHPQVPHFYNK